MSRNITRWSPVHICDCVIELESEKDDQGNLMSDNKFLLMNRVCERHKPLASTIHKENHAQLSNHVMALIEEAKKSNIDNYNAALTRCKTNFERKEVMAQLPTVLKKNEDITEEWSELVSFPHAHDVHIHDEIKHIENG
jgi:hypothetical protein